MILRHTLMLNYKQLYYFWNVAKAGSIARAAERLNLTPQTLSGQVGELQRNLDIQLFRRAGRRLELTEAGRLALARSDEMFRIGSQLEAMLSDHPERSELPFRVGLADVPESVAHRLLAPAIGLAEPVRLVCHEDKLERLHAELALHHLDLVIADRPLPTELGVKGRSHSLGQWPVAFFAASELATQYRKSFPQSLHLAPLLIPGSGAAVRASLERWFSEQEVQPRIVGEFDDASLMMAFGSAGGGIFPVPALIAEEVQSRYGVEPVGHAERVTVEYYATSPEGGLTHPAVVAVTNAARQAPFAE